MNRLSRMAALAALTVSAAIGFAQSTPPAQAPAKAPEKPKEEAPKRDEKAVAYEKAIKDLKRIDGPFPMYLRKKDILAEIDESQIGKLFLLQVTLDTGFSQAMQAGDPINWMANDVFYFERDEDSLWLTRPNVKYRWDDNDPLALASSRSFPRAVLGDYRIEQTNPETKKVLINMTSMFSGELQNLGMMLSLLGGAQFSLDRDKSGPEAVYSNNGISVVRMNQYYRSQFNPFGAMENPLAALLGGGNNLEDSRSLPIKVNYSLWFRDEKSSYIPRVSDPRVGYFTNDFYNVDRFYRRDRTDRYINRFHLQKKDPKAEMSEPVKPIVWTLDPSIPEKWRPAVREGVLRWNESFEKLGYKNAIQVVDAPKDDPNYNHADGTRNVIRFTITPDSPYAVALFRTDPLSGEILNAAVTVDANFAAYVNREYLGLAIPTTQELTAAVRQARKSLTSIPMGEPTPREIVERTFAERRIKGDDIQRLTLRPHSCTYQERAMKSMSMKFRMAKANGLQMTSDEFVSGYLADVVAHEIGHCLGLRHNFVSSTTLSPAELCDEGCVHEFGVASSVMDYTPTNVPALMAKKKDLLWNSSVGPYDNFAIEYGYANSGASNPESERFFLSQIARKSGVKGNAYMTDEDADGWNPFVVRFDSSSDPIEYARIENEANRKTRAWAIRNLPRNGESYAERNGMIVNSFARQLQASFGISAFIGGVVNNRQFRGDVNEKPNLTPVSGPTQREAMRFIARETLGVNSVDVPDAVLNSMSGDFNTGEGSATFLPLRSLISNLQQAIVGDLMSAQKAMMITENEFKAARDPQRYTLSEHYGSIMGAVFADLGGASAVNPIRRELHSFVIEGLMIQANAEPGAIMSQQRDLALGALTRVAARLKAAKSADPATQAHYDGLNARIARFMDRKMVTVN